MENKNLRKFRWFWPWQDENEEAWLREMSQNGWHLASVGLAGIYTFIPGKPQDYVYRLDYINPGKDKPAYLQLFEDAGWDYVSEMSGWQYFRKSVLDGESPEIFTDFESKIEKYRRVLAFLVILLIALAVGGTRILLGGYDNPAFLFLRVLTILLLMIYIYVVVRIWRRIHELKRL